MDQFVVRGAGISWRYAMDMRTESGRILWPMIEEILGKVDRREVTPQAMISALLFTVIFLPCDRDWETN